MQWDNEKIDKTTRGLKAPKHFQPSLTLILCTADVWWFAYMFWFHFVGGGVAQYIEFLADFLTKRKKKSKAFCSRVQMC